MRIATFVIVAVLLLAAAVYGTLAAAGVAPPPWGRPAVHRRLARGAAMCPATGQDCHANAAVTAEDLTNPANGERVTIPQDAVAMTAVDPPLRDAARIVGRVLRVDLPPGSVLRESDFYPAGTLPGAAAGVPVGKRAITLDAAQVTGSRSLRAGDHVDLDAAQSISLDPNRLKGSGVTVPPMSVKTAAVQHLARGGVVVQPLTVRQVPYQSSGGLTGTARTRTRPIEEVTIAVDPDEAAAVEQSVAAGATISCLLHSGRPTTGPTDPVAADGGTGMPQFAPVEQIVGDKHTTRFVPVPGGSR